MNVIVPDNTTFTSEFKPGLLNGVVVIRGEAPVVTVSSNGLSATSVIKKITAIPYFSWANRGEGEMQVWMPRKIKVVRLF